MGGTLSSVSAVEFGVRDAASDDGVCNFGSARCIVGSNCRPSRDITGNFFLRGQSHFS